MSARWSITILLAASALAAVLLAADTPAETATYLTATTASVSGAGETARFEILRWSTDEERERLLSAWELRAGAAGGGAGKAGRAGAKAGKAGAKGAPAAASTEAVSPEASLASALEGAATVGYLWPASETAGYTIRYAGRFPGTDGSQRILLITQRRLGALNQRWNPSAGTPNKYPFSVIELRLNAKNEGEGWVSLTGTVKVDPAVKMLAVDSGQPVVFKSVRSAKQLGGAK